MEAATPALDALIVHHHTTNKSRPILIPGIGLLSLADYLDRNGIRAQVVHLGIEEKVDPSFDVVEYAARSGVRVFGLSVHWFFQLPDSLDVARRLKELYPEVLIVLGGFTASYFCRQLIEQHPYIDVIVRGDGEVPFLKLCQAFLPRGERDWTGVPNLVYRDPAGAAIETPFTQVMDQTLFSELRATNVELFKNREVWFKFSFHLTKKFRQRFDFERNGWLCIGPTRGCAHSCPLCGGNREGQKLAYNRTRLLFQPHDAVIASLREAMGYGYKNFYLCSDPVPNGRYYLDLFRRIREEKIRVNFLFESWSLPSERFVDEFRETFEEGLLIISPDSADEEVRWRTKGGPLSYSNADLLARLRYIWDKGLATHIFFGFFLPGDTPETVMKTRRLAHELENESSEVFYLAFSSDPASPVHLHPEEHDVVIKLKSLRDYLEALPKERLSPNLMAHRPRSMTDDLADNLTAQLNLDQLFYKIFPLTMKMLRAITGGADRLHAVEEKLLELLAADMKASASMPKTARLIEIASAHFAVEGDGDAFRALRDLLRFEGAPYVLMDERFTGLGRHYTSTCNALPLAGEELARFRSQGDTVTTRHRFAFDVLALASALKSAEPPRLVERETLIELTIDRNASYVWLEEAAR